MKMFKVHLVKSELDLLNQFLPEDFKKRLQENFKAISPSELEINLDEDTADEIRELCMDEFLVSGIDENYEPNKTGIALEDIIDKFFTG
ncbi:MAG: hypothetical protein S4CHLAM45_04310 [Chlamydiales bacterium]|nr:hypothetical protein [Chlamydiales bacterium]MCH9619285.1 hypothetical protein [Chlamydiales bacterium]MCH9622547.1 hypothetical protein [Chlamydiales bacterium]